MKRALLTAGAVAILVGTPLSVIAIGKNEKGCLAGGAIGGIAGHLIGNGGTSTVLGAAGGCAVGTLVQQNKKDKQATMFDLFLPPSQIRASSPPN